MNLFIWYAISICIIGLMTFLGVKYKFSTKTAVKIMLVVSFLSEILKIFTHMNPIYKENGEMAGYYLAPPTLPFHICTLFIFVFLYLFLNPKKQKNSRLMQIFIPISFLGGLLGIIAATSGTSFTDPSTYQSFIYHSFVLWFTIFYIIKKETKFSFKSYVYCCITILGIMLAEIWINSILQVYAENGRFVNFFFVAAPPVKNLPLLNLDYGYLPYFITLYLGYIIAGFIFHLPFLIAEKKRKDKY